MSAIEQVARIAKVATHHIYNATHYNSINFVATIPF
jgi:hypothetical protein